MFDYNCTSFSQALHFNRQLSPTDRREYARMNAKEELVPYSISYNKEQKAQAFAATTEFMPPFTVQCPLKWLVTMQ